MIFDEDSYNVLEPAKFDESTEEIRHVVFHPSIGSDLNGYSDTRIHCLGKDYYYLVCQAYLTMKGKVVKKTGGAEFAAGDNITFNNLGPLFLFSKAVLEIDGREMEAVDQLGIASSIMMHVQAPASLAKTEGMKYWWYPDDAITAANNKGWTARNNWLITEPDSEGNFDCVIPLSLMFNFAADYEKVLYGYNLCLTLVRGEDHGALTLKANTDVGSVKLTSLALHMPIVTPSTAKRVSLLEMVKKQTPISLHFRERRLLTVDIPANGTEFEWNLSTISLKRRPKYVFIVLQNILKKTEEEDENPGLFKHKSVSSMSISVNNRVVALHDHAHADFEENDFSEFYRAFLDCRASIMGIDNRIATTHMSPKAFKNLFPIFSFDLSRHRTEILEQTISTRLHIRFAEASTTPVRCYALLLSDKEVILNADGKGIVVM